MKKILALLTVLTLVTSTASAAVLTDNFSDNNITANPAWTIDSGNASADGSDATVFYYGPCGPGMMSFESDSNGAQVHLDIPNVATTSAVTIDFDLFQSQYADAENSYYGFSFGFGDTNVGQGYGIDAWLTTRYYGSFDTNEWTGFSAYQPSGGFTGGVAGTSLANGWQHVKVTFDPTTGVEMYYGGNLVSYFPNFRNLGAVNRLTLQAGDTLSWFVDNVSIEYTAVPEPVTLVTLAIGGIAALRRRIA